MYINMHSMVQNGIKIRGILTAVQVSSSCWTCLIWLMWFYCDANDCKIKINTYILKTLIIYIVVYQIKQTKYVVN